MKKSNKNIFFGAGPRQFAAAIIVVANCLVMRFKLTEYSRHIKTISYSTFLDKVDQDQVKSIRISGQDVDGVMKDGTRFETVVAQSRDEWLSLRKHNIEIAVDNTSGQFSFWQFLPLLSLLLTMAALWYFMRQSRGSSEGGGGGGNIFTMGKSRAKLFMPSSIKDTFDSVAGATEAKEELFDLVDYLRNPEKYKKVGAKMPRGALLVGAPGNGKTLLARAVAGEANCPFFSISGSDFIEVFVGIGASRVRDLFQRAREESPCIVFIDEIDAVGRHRGSGLGGGHDEREQTLNQLLTEMDGFQTSDTSVVVLAATNRPDVLDSALLRPGRFDRRIEVPFPDLKSREKILQVHASGVRLDQKVNLAKIARGTPGFSGADLANLINEAAIIASKKDQLILTIEDFEEARDKILLGKELKSIMLTEEDKRLTAFHESGHTLVRLMIPEHTDPLHKVTIIPRGRALGVTHSLPEREKYTTTKEEMLATIAAALGGRAAEELVFDKLTTGAYSDFKVATSVARDMVCKHGMSDTLGSIVYAQGHQDYVYSQKTAEMIDKQLQKIIDQCYAQAMKILKNNRDKLDLLAEKLLEQETLYAGEIYTLLDIEPRVEHSFL